MSGIVLSSCIGGSPASAEDRAQAIGAEVRLIAGVPRDGTVLAGFAIDLEAGWKTYWRYPGDSGVPPVLDPAGSTNLASLAVDFPAPERFREGSDQTIGYHGSVVLPLKIVPTDPSRPVQLHIHAQLGVCRDICVPVDVSLDRTIDPAVAPPADEAADIAAAVAAVPRPAAKGAALSVVGLARNDAAKPPTVDVTVQAPPDGLKDVFVEGPEGWALPLPERTATKSDSSTWRFALDGLPSGANTKGVPLTFTLVGPDAATVQTIPLD